MFKRGWNYVKAQPGRLFKWMMTDTSLLNNPTKRAVWAGLTSGGGMLLIVAIPFVPAYLAWIFALTVVVFLTLNGMLMGLNMGSDYLEKLHSDSEFLELCAKRWVLKQAMEGKAEVTMIPVSAEEHRPTLH